MNCRLQEPLIKIDYKVFVFNFYARTRTLFSATSIGHHRRICSDSIRVEFYTLISFVCSFLISTTLF